MELNTRSFSLKSLVIGIASVGVFAISLVTYSQWLNTQSFDQNTRLLRLVQTVQQEIATGRLWFEEALGGASVGWLAETCTGPGAMGDGAAEDSVRTALTAAGVRARVRASVLELRPRTSSLNAGERRDWCRLRDL